MVSPWTRLAPPVATFPSGMQAESTRGTGTAATISGIIGIVLYAATGFVYLTSGLVVPVPWLPVLWAIWVAGLYVLVTFFRKRRVWTPLVAVGSAIVWWLFLTIGETFFDWTA